jgi:hypothetical protein
MAGDVCYERTFRSGQETPSAGALRGCPTPSRPSPSIRANRTDAQQFQLRLRHLGCPLSTNREARLRVTFFTGTGHGLGYPFDNCLCSREVRNGRHSQSYFTRNRR